MGGDPYPGYIGNWAGPQGIAAAYAIGFIDTVSAVAFRPMHVYDMIPGDVVAYVVMATAAAVCAGATDAILAHSAVLSGGQAGVAEPFQAWQQVGRRGGC
jgi:hypothetical protein